MDSLKLETILTPGGTRYRLAPRDETLVRDLGALSVAAYSAGQSFDKGFFLAVKAIQVGGPRSQRKVLTVLLDFEAEEHWRYRGRYRRSIWCRKNVFGQKDRYCDPQERVCTHSKLHRAHPTLAV